MTYTQEDKIAKELRIDCKKCFGLCCVALYFTKFEGFPTDKEAGKPCINLQSDFTCVVHKNLEEKGLKGCLAYDCFGAGQKIAQVTFDGWDWWKKPEHAKKMFEGFLVMRQLHEMLWYLMQALMLQRDQGIKAEISSLLDSTERLTSLDIDSLLELDIQTHRTKVNALLKSTSELVRSKACGGKKVASKNRRDYFGADLRKVDLKGADLRGACLIAANLRGVDLSGADLIGADLRDADLSGADLTNSIFLTQAQINTAKGDSYTNLPPLLARPAHWVKG